MDNKVTLYTGDCIDTLKKIYESGERANIVITSPPYNVNLGNNKFKKEGYISTDDNLPYDEYLNWMRDVFTSCYNVLTDDGRMCINIGDGKNGAIPTHSDFI